MSNGTPSESRGDPSSMQEYQDMKARLDRLESLVGTAYAANGTVRPALENAAAQQELEQMRQEVQAVINFLRDNNPNPEAATPF